MITAVVLVKNQEKQLAACLASLKWCEEIIVIDDFSTDNSLEVAKKHGAKVYQRALEGNFSEQRNFGLEKAKNEWVFFVDADEVVSEELAKEMYEQISQFLSPANGYYIPRRDVMWGKELKHGETGNQKFLRLGKKDKGHWEGRVHEQWKLMGEIDSFKNPLYHHPHPTVAEFLKEINLYTTLRARDLHAQKKKVRFWSVIFYPLGKFIYNFIGRLGFLDGVRGMILALMMSFHSFLVRGKLWQLNQIKKKYNFGVETN